MSVNTIVTQHFDDPIGSIMEIDGQCYVKATDKTGVIDKYIYDGMTKIYYQSHQDFIDKKYGNMLCRPKFGVELYSIGNYSSLVALSPGLVSILPTAVEYSAAYSFTRCLVDIYIYPSNASSLPTDISFNAGRIISLTRVTTKIITSNPRGFPSNIA